jgi:hypothetical protein
MKVSRNTSRKLSKINQVFRKWPKGTVATQDWLTEQGVSSKLAIWHVGSGWLARFGPRAFTQPDDQVDWRGGLYALQTQLGMTVHAGGVTSLELQGRSHFIPLGEKKMVILISDRPEQLPAWFKKHQWKDNVEHRCLSLFENVPKEATTQLDCGGFKVAMSSAERAIMEQIHMAGSNNEIEHVLQLMEGLTTLRPQIAQELLESCRSAKVKRVFLWSAETAGHSWFNRLDLSRFDLGKGKRQIYKGGRLNQKYGITVPGREEFPYV